MNTVDFDFCASSFLTLRHVCKPNVQWKPGWTPFFIRRDFSKNTPIFSALQMDELIKDKIEHKLSQKNLGIMLSGGMDSAILASYLPKGTKAYTLKSQAHGAENEIDGAVEFAKINGLDLNIVEVSWDDYLTLLPILMQSKKAPIHSIEPLIAKALHMAKSHGINAMLFGENADSLFGGMDQLLTSSTESSRFIERYTYVNPKMILRNPVDVAEVFDPYIDKGVVNAHAVMQGLFADEGLNSYINPCKSEGVQLVAPFAELRMGKPLDLNRIKSGDSKYLIRDLFRLRYPDLTPPPKKPMPRAVGIWLRDWAGPTHEIFNQIEVNKLTSDQKWYVFCLEKFTQLLEQT